jgi:hypothetical protein
MITLPCCTMARVGGKLLLGRILAGLAGVLPTIPRGEVKL